jgi:hypothetical protein
MNDLHLYEYDRIVTQDVRLRHSGAISARVAHYRCM